MPPATPNGKMARGIATNALGSVKLSYEQLLSDEHLQGVQDVIRQAGLLTHDCRRFVTRPVERIDHVVEVLANYEDLTLDQWSNLTDSFTKT
jgi:hypothetical protein